MKARFPTQKRLNKNLIAAVILTLGGICLLLGSPGSRAQQEPNRQLVQTNAQRVANARRIALVIGNGGYSNAPALKNPPNDARDMAANLKTLGFDVSSGVNVSQREMKRLIREFGQKLKAGGSGLFYYAGHGVQARGHNYIIPIDADIQSEADVEDSGVDVGLVLNYMDDAQNGLNIVILDACRNNPFSRSFRSASEGLAQVDAPTGTLIAYATAPGKVAADGVGENGLYTSELLKAMRQPGLTATDMFMQVRAEVMKRTGNKQVPWEASSLVGSFYFNGIPTNSSLSNSSPNNTAPTETRFDAAAFEYNYWDSIKNSTNADDFKAYVEKYPAGQFVTLAKNRIRTLEVSKPLDTAAKSGTDSAAELAFWDVIKSSTNADDFRAYLKKFPNGLFLDLANNRLKILEKNEDARRAADETARLTRSFKVALFAGTTGFIARATHDGELTVSPGKLEFKSPAEPKYNFSLPCTEVAEASVTRYKTTFNLKTKSDSKKEFTNTADVKEQEARVLAQTVVQAIHEACSPSPQVTPTAESGSDSLEGTIWKGASPGGDKQYEFQFLPGGKYRGKSTLGKSVFLSEGTWKQVGNTVSINSTFDNDRIKPFTTEATINQDTMQGSSMGGKYKFTMKKVQ